MSKPIVFIIGAGKNVGASTASIFLSKGYRVARAARSIETSIEDEDNISLKVDLASPDTVIAAFAKIRQVWGEPGVVIYNGRSAASGGCRF